MLLPTTANFLRDSILWQTKKRHKGVAPRRPTIKQTPHSFSCCLKHSRFLEFNPPAFISLLQQTMPSGSSSSLRRQIMALRSSSVAHQVCVSAFVGVVFDNLSTLIEKEVGIIWGVDEELKKLGSTLSTILDVLEDAEKKQIWDVHVREWLLKLQDWAYDAGDMFDDWETQAGELPLGAKHERWVCLSFLCFCSKQHRIARQVNYLQKKMDEISRPEIADQVNDLLNKLYEIVEGISRFQLRERILGMRLERVTSWLPTDTRVYGREEEKRFIVTQILNYVKKDQQLLSVLPIVGVGGLGKTTLAQMCYNDHRVVEHFDVRIWVVASDDFDVKRLTRTIIASIGGGAPNIQELGPLQNLLKKKLAKKRFLLVLDDVWNEDQKRLNSFKNSLTCGAIGSSIIITTRLLTVAMITCTHTPFYLSPLPPNDCWRLFRASAFGMENDASPNLMIIGKEIVKIAEGVPVAAKILGGLMRFKHGEKDWWSVLGRLNFHQYQTYKNPVLAALRLSYDDLDPHSRQCLVYCSVFPKDHRMKKDELIRLWMANGFIRSKWGMQMEDIGNEIFKGLSLRSFFQNEEKNAEGAVVSFMMHDLVHDLICSFSTGKFYSLTEGNHTRNVHPKVRHLSVCSVSVVQSIHELPPYLHTFILPISKCGNDIDLGCLKSLRALSLKEEKYNIGRSIAELKVLDSLGNLKHLRYLNISFSEIELLPDSLCELRKLQTLELEGCMYLKKLPRHMGNMRSLRHLNMKGCHSLSETPIGMGKLICLRTLSFFIVSRENGPHIEELRELKHLSGEVEIRGLSDVKTREEAEEAMLMRKKNIVSLKLVWDRRCCDMGSKNHHSNVFEGLQPHRNIKRLHMEGYQGLTFPSWLDLDVLSSLPNLVEISIHNCSKCEHLPSSLGVLPLLRRLLIGGLSSVNFFLSSEMNDVAHVFPSLQYLELDDMSGLEDWFSFTGNSIEEVILFPCLEELVIENCPKLKRLPPSALLLLRSLRLTDCDPLILVSLQDRPPISVNICFSDRTNGI